VSLKNDIDRELGVQTRIGAGAPGSLNVFVNGKKIFSYKEAGRLPAAAEIISLIREQS
jgi:predicted Rdx family selenoprotein